MTDPAADPVRAWQHDALADDLARHLRAAGDRVVWTNIPLGMAGSIRPDALAMDKSFSRPRFTVYEVKVSRSDFLADTNAGKWQGYWKVGEAIYFAVPEGLIKKAQVPEGAGLMLRGPSGWRTVLAPRRRPVEKFPEAFWQKLLIDGIQRQADVLGREQRAQAEARWRDLYAARERLGVDFCRFLSQRSGLEAELEELRRRRDRDRAALATEREAHQTAMDRLKGVARNAIAEALGVPLPENDWEVRELVRARLSSLEASGARRRARAALDAARMELERIARRVGADDLEPGR
jgi:hypothetical protein